jgi:hypothetical protein
MIIVVVELIAVMLMGVVIVMKVADESVFCSHTELLHAVYFELTSAASTAPFSQL